MNVVGCAMDLCQPIPALLVGVEHMVHGVSFFDNYSCENNDCSELF